MAQTVLVTGGAGYVGSHVVRALVEHGRRVLVLDDLSTGHAASLRGVEWIRGDLGDRSTLDALFGAQAISAVVHMAASCDVAESMLDPAAYYRNNLVKSLSLLDAVKRHGVRDFVFSSSAAVYGEGRGRPIVEDRPCVPTNPYGETKLAFERALSWYASAFGLRWAALRYFNAAGAHPDGNCGEDHASESHLIPRLLLSLLHAGEPTPILGEDYPTDDGTCVRDYVHVADLARAHDLALAAIEQGRCLGALNLGNGAGFSVKQIIAAVQRVTGRRPPTRSAPRRRGDPAILVASAARAGRELGWTARSDLVEIVETAWNWHRRHPHGYGGGPVEAPRDPD